MTHDGWLVGEVTRHGRLDSRFGKGGWAVLPFLHQPGAPAFKDRSLVVQWQGPLGASLNETDRVTRRMTVGPRPNQLACTPDGKIAYVPCDDAAWWVIDTVNAKVLKKIATFLPVSDEMLEDYAQIQSYLDARLALFVRLQKEVQLLRGDGTGTNLVGILNRTGLAPTVATRTASPTTGQATGVYASPTTDNDMDAIYRQIIDDLGMRVTKK